MTAEETRLWKHELRTPINHIIGYSELLVETAADFGEKAMEERARILQAAGRSLAGVVDQYLSSRPQENAWEDPHVLSESAAPFLYAILDQTDSLQKAGDYWSEDLRRIRAAAGKLLATLHVKKDVSL